MNEATNHSSSRPRDHSTARKLGVGLLTQLLRDRGYSVRSMGIVWNGGLCVENHSTDRRASIFLDCVEVANQDWQASYLQQKAIERVGWTCLRLDVLSFLTNIQSAMNVAEKFLFAAGVQPIFCEKLDGAAADDISKPLPDHESAPVPDHVGIDALVAQAEERRLAAPPIIVQPCQNQAAQDDDSIEISSHEEDGMLPSSPNLRSGFRSASENRHDELDPASFGSIVDLDFLPCTDQSSITGSLLPQEETSAEPSLASFPQASQRRGKRKQTKTHGNDSGTNASAAEDDDEWKGEDGASAKMARASAPKRTREEEDATCGAQGEEMADKDVSTTSST